MKMLKELARLSSALLGVLILVLAVSGCSESVASGSSSGEYHACRSCRYSGESTCSSGHCPFATVTTSVESPPATAANESTAVHAVPASYERTNP